jgi:hypothetical protein
MKGVGDPSGSVQTYRFRSPNCNQVKGLSKFDYQLAIGPAAVRNHKVQQSPFLTCHLLFKQLRRTIGPVALWQSLPWRRIRLQIAHQTEGFGPIRWNFNDFQK